MLRYFSLLLIVVSLSGCFATKKRCLRLYPPTQSRDTVVIETVRDSAVYKDTTLYVSIPGEILHDSIPVPMGPGIIISDTLRLDTKFARAEAWYKSPMIYLTLTQKDTTLQFRFDSLKVELYKWKDRYTDILTREVTPVKYIPGVYRGALWAWVGVIIMIIFNLVRKQFKLF